VHTATQRHSASQSIPPLPAFLLLASTLALVPALARPAGAAASGEPAAETPPPEPAALDACALLSHEEVAAVQEDEVVEATPSRQVSAELEATRCYYRTADFARSVSLEVTRRDPSLGDGPGARERWRSLFAGAGEDEEPEGEPVRRSRRHHPSGEIAAPAEAPDERSEAAAVEGLGDEAYWVGTAVYGALYVLRGDAYLRLSLGGPGDLESKLERARRLAAAALPRLAGSE
jgi:hypothetical protein